MMALPERDRCMRKMKMSCSTPSDIVNTEIVAWLCGGGTGDPVVNLFRGGSEA